MYITEVPNRKSPPAVLLRESYRQGGKVKNRTLANLSKLPKHAVEALRRVLRGEVLVAPDEAFVIEASATHGHVQAVLTAMRKIGLDNVVSSRRCRERNLVLGMIAARILEPSSKLETTRWWRTTSLPEKLGVEDADEDDLYAAMDWLLERQPAIERKLASRHLKPWALVLYDLTSTWVEGTTCPLAARGYSRDGKKNKLQINFGVVTDEVGRPVSVTVYPGNTADSTTVQEQVERIREEFGISLIVFVGDRGMVTETQIDTFLEQGGVEWITALRSSGIRKLKAEGSLQLGLFDDRNLFEFESPRYPDERLVACRNPELAEHRAHKRRELIAATKAELDKVQRMVKRGKLSDKGEIGVRVGRVINKYKVAKHFKVEIGDDAFHYRVRAHRVEAEAALDGIYVIRTSVSNEIFSGEDAVRHYKRLTRIERAFRSMKTVSLKVRPIYHRLESRVRAHIFLCMLAYHVEWHMRRVWSPLLFADEIDTSDTRDPVAPARPSQSAREKAATKRTEDDLPVHSFASLLAHLSSVVKNRCRRKQASENEPTFEMYAPPDQVQRRAFDLIASL